LNPGKSDVGGTHLAGSRSPSRFREACKTMAKNQGQGTQDEKAQNTEDDRKNNLPMPIDSNPPKDLTDTKYDIVGKTDVDPEKVAKSVPYDDEGYSEAGLANDNI
jgi:hypothetical protein